jgi:lipopolysaccharide export LptBFGC system permease protein LptF
MKRFIGPIVIGFIFLGAVISVLSVSEEAREVAGEGFWNVFRFFTTPFILELSVAVMGLLSVMTYNQWKRSKEGPEWVEMEVVSNDDKESDSSPPAS